MDAYDSFVCKMSESYRPPEELRNILIAYLESYTSRGNLMVSEDDYLRMTLHFGGNEFLSILVFLPMVTLDNFLHFSNAFISIDVTLSGIVI